MPVQLFRAENFRCLERIELAADPQYNLVSGANASGKTSLLEALAYLGRGKSFRGAQPGALVRHGQRDFTLFGKVNRNGQTINIGLRNSRDGLEIRIDGETEPGSAALAEVLPLQVIDPDVHDLVGGSPEHRRRYLDWVAFHVEHDFLGNWRRFRRALRQRNAALKAGGTGSDAWTAEVVELGGRIDAARRAVVALCAEHLENHAGVLLGGPVGVEYRPGWSAGRSLAEALAAGRERDLQLGSTQEGPHRADLVLSVDEHRARPLVSRGQQKLLACAMVLAATETVQAELGQRMLLLLDDPQAELDRDSLARLLGQVFSLDCQIVATALEPEALEFPRAPARFHVEHGVLERLA